MMIVWRNILPFNQLLEIIKKCEDEVINIDTLIEVPFATMVFIDLIRSEFVKKNLIFNRVDANSEIEEVTLEDVNISTRGSKKRPLIKFISAIT